MKTLLRILFFLMLVPQICFGQWVQVGLNDKSINDIAIQNSNIFAVTSDSGKVYRSIDNGANWNMIVDSNAVDVAISGTGKIFMVWDSLRTSDPFATSPVCLLSSIDNANIWVWSNIMEQLSDSIWRGNPQTITVNPEGIVFCGVWADRPDRFQLDIIAISNDDGLVWTTPGMGVLGGKLFDFRNQFVITYGIISGAGAGGHDIHLSSDYGNTWTYLGWPLYENLPYLALGFFPNGNIIIGGNEYLLLSSDMCSTWTEIATLNSQVGLSYSSGSSEGMLIGTEVLGVFLFSDEGDSLGSRNEGLTNLNIHALTLDSNGYVYAGTENGVWRRPLSEIVPVELTSFTATSNGEEVILSWTTATETNNSGFEILRSTQNDNEWKLIGYVPGFGTTTEPKSYSYTDSKLLAGKYTYRLKQIDFDGSFEYSQEIEVEVSAPLTFNLEQNYPNPFNPTTVISYQSPVSSDVTLKVYDILGNEIATLVDEYKPAGRYEVEFNAVSLPSGVYFYQLQAGEYTAVKKMLLLK